MTGGIATGKSTAIRYLRDKGFIIIDADNIAHELMEKGGRLAEEVAREFGEHYLSDGAVDRKRLGALVFADEEARKRLNAISHPAIYRRIGELLSKASTEADKSDILFIDIPLYFEGGEARKGLDADSVWLISADEKTQLKRLMARDGWTKEEALARMAAQMPMDRKRRLADVVIDNSAATDDLYQAIDKALEREKSAADRSEE